MENKKTGCSGGKTIVIDPNTFDGHDSMSNVSVPLEDLSITVQLETKKKARTILTTSGVKNIGNSSQSVRLKFIEGTQVGGEKVLTTKYTDLTTVLNGGDDGEDLGITNIEIDFNSSYAPMVVINFIDLRGSSVFQNEETLSNGTNKYSSFFQLPYPIFYLTIKGYYGMPVRYQLHMRKFTAKFNSQTGNFEITASFIGYTYAMLNDMLLGYLRAIPYTAIGASRYEKVNAQRLAARLEKIPTLDELMVKISNIDTATKRIASTDPDAAQLNNGSNKKTELETIKSLILTMGQTIDVIKDQTSDYRFILSDPRAPNQDTITNTAIKTYTTEVTKIINVFNEGNPETKEPSVSPEIKIDVNDFTNAGLTKGKYHIQFDWLIPFTPTFTPTPSNSSPAEIADYDNKLKIDAANKQSLRERFNLKGGQISDGDFDDKRSTLKAEAIRRGFSTGSSFDVIDMSSQYNKLSKTADAVAVQLKVLQKSLANKIKNEVAKQIGLDPSIRNIISIFTTAAEVFLGSVYDVSASAGSPSNTPRLNQLKKFSDIPDSYDIKTTTLTSNPSNSSSGALTPIYYPWPDYRVDDAVDGLVETYLGSPGVIDVPSQVDELVFVNDLLQAFLTSKKKADAAQEALVNGQKNWIPINPLDTRLFIDTFPYKRFGGNTRADVINFILIRAFIYIGLTNRGLTPDELKAIANADMDSLLADIPNDIILQSLKTLTIQDFKDAKGLINNSEMPMMKYLSASDAYYYNYIFGIAAPMTGYNTASATDAEGIHVLPINNGFTLAEGKNEDEWPSPIGTNVGLLGKRASGSLFLTNYTTDISNGNKQDDGGIYVKIVDIKDYDGVDAKTLPTIQPSDKILILSELKKEYDEFDKEAVGFNQFGGKYGTQEYRVMNFDDTDNIARGAFMSVFYQNANFGANTFNKSNGLGIKRQATAKTDFDIDNKAGSYFIAQDWTPLVPFSDSAIDNVVEVIDGSKPMHESYGKNRLLLNQYLATKDNTITYPYINFQVSKDTDDANFGQSTDVAPVSLFGSRLYYEQTGQYGDYAKALLFLHTFPWNGLVQDEATSVLTSIYSHKKGIFTANEILNTFGNRAGFISAPKLWVAFIGGLLWRSNASESGPTDPIKFRNATESFIPSYSIATPVPTRNEYITSENDLDYPHGPMVFPSPSTLLPLNFEGYKPLEALLLTLPYQIKQEFVAYFKDFVYSTNGVDSDWSTIKQKLEVFTGDGLAWTTAWNTIMTDPTALFNETTNVAYKTKKLAIAQVKAQYNALYNGKPVFDSYIVFTPYYGQSDFDYNYVLELRDDAPAVNTLLDLFSSEVMIANMSYKPWQASRTQTNFIGDPTSFGTRSGVFIKNTDLTIYLDAVIAKVKPVDGGGQIDKVKQAEQEIFGTENENIIKLQLYRTCKNLYDKWIGGTGDDDIFFQGNDNRNELDFRLAEKDKLTNPRLIDSFRFVDRTFSDIGDKLIINPVPVGEFLRSNPNSSFYDSVASLLAANNFDFIALPTYINYGDPETLTSMFKPMTSNDGFKNGTVGPSFVCVYVGQTSKHLDFNSSEYTDDGVNFKCKDGALLPTKAKDFTNDKLAHENNVAVFAVNYSQQNQNIFKDITLDQSEFGETAESIQVTDEIASKGAENKKTFGGQNLYNVHSVRAYSTSIDMMGNAMIQPMMYFQLNNIPMYHGAYMITRVKHSLKPNSMSTNFSGVRIRNVATPLLDVTEIYMSLLETIETTSVAESSQAFGTSASTASSTLTESGVVAGGVVSNTNNNFAPITSCKAPSKQVKSLTYYTKENPGPNITSTKITHDDLITYLNGTNLTAAEKRATYTVAMLEQGKKGGFNAFGNNLFGFNVEGSFAGLDTSIKEGKLINTFCYGDAERGRVFPQFSQWSDSVKVFAQYTVKPRFIEASRQDGYWKKVVPSLNFYQNGIKDTDSLELQALKFTVLYFMEWNSPAYKVDVVNSIGTASNPSYLVDYTDPATNTKRHPKHVHDAYISAAVNFK